MNKQRQITLVQCKEELEFIKRQKNKLETRIAIKENDMESEKVKEIKKDIEICMKSLNCNGCSYKSSRSGECCKNLTNDILTYINELEERIKELEEGIAQSMLGCEFLPECTNDKLKQFAERLKNKLFEFFQDNEELDGKISVGPLYVDVIGVEAKDGTIISLGLIDELLKEYEK